MTKTKPSELTDRARSYCQDLDELSGRRNAREYAGPTSGLAFRAIARWREMSKDERLSVLNLSAMMGELLDLHLDLMRTHSPDAECTECGSCYWSGDPKAHPTVPMCPKCYADDCHRAMAPVREGDYLLAGPGETAGISLTGEDLRIVQHALTLYAYRAPRDGVSRVHELSRAIGAIAE